MSTVFITQRSKDLDYTDLNGFGHVRSIATRSIYPDEAEERIEALLVWARSILVDYRADEDYIALSGDPTIIAIVFMMAVDNAREQGVPYVRILKWDRRASVYYESRVPVAMYAEKGSSVCPA